MTTLKKHKFALVLFDEDCLEDKDHIKPNYCWTFIGWHNRADYYDVISDYDLTEGNDEIFDVDGVMLYVEDDLKSAIAEAHDAQREFDDPVKILELEQTADDEKCYRPFLLRDLPEPEQDHSDR